MALESLPEGYRAAVFGASGGIGTAFVNALDADERCVQVHAGSRRGSAVRSAKVRAFSFDLESEPSIAAAAVACAADGPLHLVVVATGILHDATTQPEKRWRALSPEALLKTYALNAIGPALIAKHMLGHLATGEKAVFAALSARVGSISDNRLGGWHAYRASKAALNMLIRTFAVELAVRNKSALCIALHPGTVDTVLSQPFQSGVKPGQLLSATVSVERLMRVLDCLVAEQTGQLFAWDGTRIPF